MHFSSRLDELENRVAAVEHNGDSNQDKTAENASPETDLKGAELAKLRQQELGPIDDDRILDALC